MNIKIKKMRDNAILPKSHNGDWIDCYNSVIGCVDGTQGEFTFDNIVWYEDGLTYSKGDIIVVKLGFAMELPKGYEAYILPRSGTFRKTRLLLTNSQGVVDNSYCGNEDEWMAMFYATGEGHIDIGDRLVQIRIQKSQPSFEFTEVDDLENEDRGGYGSSGK